MIVSYNIEHQKQHIIFNWYPEIPIQSFNSPFIIENVETKKIL